MKQPLNKFNPENVAMYEQPDGTFPERYQNIIINDFMHKSRTTALGQLLPMDDLYKKFTYQTKGPGAYWVSETQKIKTTKAEWVSAEMRAHKLGVILPASKEWLTWGMPRFFEEMRPQLVDAIYKKIDEAVFLGVDSPFPQSVKGVAEKNHLISGPINYANMQDLKYVLRDNRIKSNAIVSSYLNDRILAGITEPIEVGGQTIGVSKMFQDAENVDPDSVVEGRYDGLPVVNLGTEELEKGTVISGDFNQLYYGIPRGIEYSITDSAQLSTLTNDDGTPVNLWEQDMVALKVTFYFGMMIVKDDAFSIIEPAEQLVLKAGVDKEGIMDNGVFVDHIDVGEVTRVAAFGGTGNVTFTSSDDAVATVVQDPGTRQALVSGKAKGKATIAVTAGSETATVDIYVGSGAAAPSQQG